ncbi:unnamed protein product [Vicia faba]|uniref:Uncharacterized protein n=1 Tax=Vicia faba TaxID=3906 RepID=A0AAV1AXU9_VICFA|nr:unnamed protein product [Vicia faba]
MHPTSKLLIVIVCIEESSGLNFHLRVAKPLITELVALTEKKMDMTLDDIIKMSKNPKFTTKQTRVSNKSKKFTTVLHKIDLLRRAGTWSRDLLLDKEFLQKEGANLNNMGNWNKPR